MYSKSIEGNRDIHVCVGRWVFNSKETEYLAEIILECCKRYGKAQFNRGQPHMTELI